MTIEPANEFQLQMNKSILCLDFDGTIHSYVSGWQGAGVISDEPVASAFDFIKDASQHFDVQVYSARSGLPGGIDAMKAWFTTHGWPVDQGNNPAGLSFPSSKPPAHVSIDDRAMTFTGTWPTMQMLNEFRPWNDLDA